MGYVVRMPQLGMSMEEGTVVEWVVAEGSAVAAEAVIAVVESEKTSVEVEAREDGVLRRIVVGEGGTVEPGDPIGIVAGPDEALDEYEAAIETPDPTRDADRAGSDPGPTPSAGSGGASAVADAGGGSAAGGATGDGTIRATPGARRLAEEEGVDLGSVQGSGPQGVVTEDDVERALGSGDGAGPAGDEPIRATPGARRLAEREGVDLARVNGTGPQGVITEDDVEATAETDAAGGATRTVAETRRLSSVQKTIGERLGRSAREAVHVTLNRSFDAGAARSAVTAARERGVECSVTDLLLAAVGRALGEHPAFNALFEDGEHRLVEEINVAVAVDVDAGLLTPVIPDVGRKPVERIAERRRELTERARVGEHELDDLAGGTFTVSNLGPYGVDSFDPVIDPPQIGILGVGRIRPDDTATLSLSFDHRVVNGADAARFLGTIVDGLTDPGTLSGFFEADLTVGASGREREDRRIAVSTPSDFAGSYRAAGREIAFDEPIDAGGTGTAPTPVEHLLGALGACLSAATRSMARRDGLELGAIECDVDGSPDHGPLEAVAVDLRFETDADDDAVETVVTKAERACYVERALSDEVDVAVGWSRRG